MGNTLKLSIVGCRFANYMAKLARLTPGVELTACCDIVSERANAFAKKYKIPAVYTDYAELFAEAPLDAVYLAVPHNLHFEMAKAAVDAGVHVFVEKPITRTVAEGQEIVTYASEKGIKIGVNYQYRYDKAGYKLAYLVQSGQLGRVLYARTNIPWHREQGYFDKAPWHKTIAQAGGGTLITQASHLIDLLLWAIGSPPVSVSGFTDQKIFTDVEVEDFAAGTVVLKNGAVLQITSSMVAATEQAVTIEVYGERGTVTYTDQPRPRVKFIGKRNRVYSENSVSKGNGSNPEPGPNIAGGNGRAPYFGFHALHRSLKGFRDWILHDQLYLIPGEAALPALAVVEGIYQSAATGQRITIQGE